MTETDPDGTGEAPDRASPTMRIAFYGRTNQRSGQDAARIAHQYRSCIAAIGTRGITTRVYYDMLHPRRRVEPWWLAEDVREAGGPAGRDGGWLDLVEILPDRDRGFDAVVIADPTRVSRRTRDVIDFEQRATVHHVGVRYATGGAALPEHGLSLVPSVACGIADWLETTADRYGGTQ